MADGLVGKLCVSIDINQGNQVETLKSFDCFGILLLLLDVVSLIVAVDQNMLGGQKFPKSQPHN